MRSSATVFGATVNPFSIRWIDEHGHMLTERQLLDETAKSIDELIDWLIERRALSARSGDPRFFAESSNRRALNFRGAGNRRGADPRWLRVARLDKQAEASLPDAPGREMLPRLDAAAKEIGMKRSLFSIALVSCAGLSLQKMCMIKWGTDQRHWGSYAC
jgi:hypothetical protein